MYGKPCSWKNICPTQNKKDFSKTYSPWITYEVTRKIHKRNYLKRRATVENNVASWEPYKPTRNETKMLSNQLKGSTSIHASFRIEQK